MRRFKIMLFAAVVFAVGSAFTSVKDSSDQVYVEAEGIVTPIEEADGRCEQYGAYCSFKLAEDGETRLPQDSNSHWEPN